jgi:predicted dehydrogenase
MIRLGVAGLGGLGEALIRDVPKVAGLSVVAVQDVVADRARDVAAGFGVAWAGERFADLLEVDGVDAAVICTPNGLHAEQAQAALRAGKDVLVQKPLAVSSSDAQATVNLAARLERVLFVDYTYRFLDTMRLFRELCPPLAEVRSARAAFHNIYGPGAAKGWSFDPRMAGGGALIDLGVHLLDLGLWLLGPQAVSLESAELSEPRPVEHSALLRVGLGSVPFEVAVSWRAPLPSTEIYFEVVTANGGVLRWENVDGSFFHFRTLRDGGVLVDRETTLREDTLRAFVDALAHRRAPTVDTRVYALLDQAYGRAT